MYFCFRSSTGGIFLLGYFSLGLRNCVLILVLGLQFSFLRAQCVVRSSVPRFLLRSSSIFLYRPSGFGPFFCRSSVLASRTQVFHQRFSFLDSTRSFTSLVLAAARVLVLRRSVLIFVVRARSDPMHTPDLGFQSCCLAWAERCPDPICSQHATDGAPGSNFIFTNDFCVCAGQGSIFHFSFATPARRLRFPIGLLNSSSRSRSQCCFLLAFYDCNSISFLLDFFIKSRSQLCVDCLRVEAGHVLEPPDQRFEVFSFSSCFTRGFFVTHIKCSMKYVWDSSSDFGHQNFAHDLPCCHTLVLKNKTKTSVHMTRMFKSHVQWTIW
jgi:hypothetical protein